MAASGKPFVPIRADAGITLYSRSPVAAARCRSAERSATTAVTAKSKASPLDWGTGANWHGSQDSGFLRLGEGRLDFSCDETSLCPICSKHWKCKCNGWRQLVLLLLGPTYVLAHLFVTLLTWKVEQMTRKRVHASLSCYLNPPQWRHWLATSRFISQW